MASSCAKLTGRGFPEALVVGMSAMVMVLLAGQHLNL